MYMANVTEIRQNVSRIIARVLETGDPAVVLQRSKPVAYIVEASAYEEMVKKLATAENLLQMVETKKALRELAALRGKMAKRGRQQDSVPVILDLREGKIR